MYYYVDIEIFLVYYTYICNKFLKRDRLLNMFDFTIMYSNLSVFIKKKITKFFFHFFFVHIQIYLCNAFDICFNDCPTSVINFSLSCIFLLPAERNERD